MYVCMYVCMYVRTYVCMYGLYALVSYCEWHCWCDRNWKSVSATLQYNYRQLCSLLCFGPLDRHCVCIKHLHMAGVNWLPHFLLNWITDWAPLTAITTITCGWTSVSSYILDSIVADVLPYVHPLNHLRRCPKLIGEECSGSSQTGLLYACAKCDSTITLRFYKTCGSQGSR